MGLSDLQVVRALKEKLRFHGQRQRVIAENIANATTPRYVGQDLKAPDFFRMAVSRKADPPVRPAMTSPAHLPGQVISTRGAFDARGQDGYEVTPDGNAVVLEEQMMKLAENQMDYQVATSLYQRSLGLLRTAVGRR